MIMRSILGSGLLLLLCAACGNSAAPVGRTTPVTSSTPAVPVARYDLANGCFALKSIPANTHVVGSGGTYAATATDLAQAEPFYMKPTALGRYLFYSHDQLLLTGNDSNSGVAGAAAASDGADWVIDTVAPGQYLVKMRVSGKALATGSGGQLVLASAATPFAFVPATGCTPYPEMPLGIEGETFKGNGIDKPVIGFADGHTHMAMSSEESDGTGNVGPSGGGVLYGQMFNRFGVTEALKDCAVNHGPNGVKDAQFVVEGGAPSTHETKGWPTFVGWPVNPNITHQGMYYRWLERAYKSGLRLMVNLGTNIEALCEVGTTAGLGTGPGTDCKDMSLGLKQIHYTYQLQDYIDAQEGGPGKGWFRIVKTPAEARAVINDGKLAVVLGLEFANIFDCNVSFDPAGNETDSCDQAHIDQRIKEISDLGVRQVYLYHDVNNALGGTGLFSFSLNLIGYYGTHRFWDTYACPNVPYFAQDVQFPTGGAFYTAGFESPAAIPGTGSDPITSALLSAAGGTLPLYPPGRLCNARGTTSLGNYAIRQAMKQKFVLDVDHAELTVKQDMIALAKAQTPVYPLVSMHGGHGGITLDMAKDILNLGGVIFPYNPNGATAVAELNALKAIWPAGRPLAMGYGFDGNGFGGMAQPRGAGHPQISYPFKLFEGPGWGPQFAAAGIKPMMVDELTIPESGKTWNADVDGHPHYGEVADLVEEIRLEGGEQAVSAFYNSAEAYIEMWEKVENR